MQYKRMCLSKPCETRIFAGGKSYTIEEMENPQNDINRKLKTIEKYLERY